MNKYLNLINPTAEDIKVIGRIVSVANDGVVASAYQIWDEYLHMWQGEINKKLYEYAVKHEGNIDYINDELENIHDQLEKIKMGGIVDIIVNGVNMRNGSEIVVDLGTVIRDLSNYYTKNETYNKEEIQNLVDRLPKMTIIKVDVLPEDPSQYVENIVLVSANPGEESNYYDEYIVSISETETPDGHGRLNYAWEKIGSTKVDLSNYATKEDWPGTEYELFEDIQDVWNTWLDSKNRPRSWVCLDNDGKIPASLLPNLNDTYIPKSEKGQAYGVATLGSDGKVPAYQLQDYILSSQKGQPNGVAILNADGVVPAAQLQFPTRGPLDVSQINNLDYGVYWVNGKVISQNVLGGDQANGILVAYPYGSKVQVLYVGRAAGAASGEQVEVYTRRYLATPQRWTEWSNTGSDEYTLTKNGTNIELKKNGLTISSVADSNTTYTTMTSAQASAGTSTTGQLISAKVLKGELDKKVNAEEGKWLSTNDFTDEDLGIVRNMEGIYVVHFYGSDSGVDQTCDKTYSEVNNYMTDNDSSSAIAVFHKNGNSSLETGIYNYCGRDDNQGFVFVCLERISTETIVWHAFILNPNDIVTTRSFTVPISGGGADLSNYYTKAESDAKYLTEHQDISGKANISDLATVATSGSYNDLSNKPTIPTVPANISAFTNDAGYITSYTETDPTVPAWAKEATKPTYDYSEITNTPTIPTVPTNVSAFTNDAGYLTEHQSLSNYITNDQLDERLQNNIIYGELIDTNTWQPTSLSDDEVRDIIMTGGGQTLCISGDSSESQERKYYANLAYRDRVLDGSVLQDVYVYARPYYNGSVYVYRTYTITISTLGIDYSYGSDNIGG